MHDKPKSNQMEAMTSAHLNELKEKVKGISTAMMTTSKQGGGFAIRPMATQELDVNGNLWFFTYASSRKATELGANRHVSVSYENHSSETYVILSGEGEVTRDRSKINELWTDALKAWFPNGKEDPQVCLVKVTVTGAEYWDRPGGKIATLFQMAKAAVTGEPDTQARHEKIG